MPLLSSAVSNIFESIVEGESVPDSFLTEVPREKRGVVLSKVVYDGSG